MSVNTESNPNICMMSVRIVNGLVKEGKRKFVEDYTQFSEIREKKKAKILSKEMEVMKVRDLKGKKKSTLLRFKALRTQFDSAVRNIFIKDPSTVDFMSNS